MLDSYADNGKKPGDVVQVLQLIKKSNPLFMKIIYGYYFFVSGFANYLNPSGVLLTS